MRSARERERVCVCVCVRERERERQRGGPCHYVCMCVCVRERKRGGEGAGGLIKSEHKTLSLSVASSHTFVVVRFRITGNSAECCYGCP